MSKVVLIHGIAQEQKSASKLLEEWLPDLRGGLENAGFKQLSRDVREDGDVSVDMVFYGGLFLRPGLMGADDEELPEEAAKIAERLADEWLTRAETRSQDEKVRREATEARKGLVQAGGEPQGIKSSLRSVTAALAKISWFAHPTFAVAEVLAGQALRQVSLYLSNTNDVRDRTIERRIGRDRRVNANVRSAELSSSA